MMQRLIERFSDGLSRIGIRLGINARSLAKNSAYVTMGHAVAVLRGVVTGYIVARLFPRTLYGEYQWILAVIGTLSSLGIPEIYKASARAIARGESGALLEVAWRQFLICIVGSAALLLMIPVLPYFHYEGMSHLLLAAAVLFPCSQVAGMLFSGITLGTGNFVLALKANIVSSTLLVISTLCILAYQPSPLLMLIATIGIPIIVNIAFARAHLPKHASKKGAKAIVQYGLELTLLNLPITLSWKLDYFLISANFGLNQLAVFSVALLIPEQLKVWVGELLSVTFQSQARGEDSRARRRKLLKFVGILTLLFGMGIVAYIAITPYVFRLLFPNYLDAIFLSQIAAAILITVPSSLLMQYLEAQAMVSALRWIRWIAAGVYCSSLLLLVPHFGLIGALLSRGLLRLMYTLCTLYFLLQDNVKQAPPTCTENPMKITSLPSAQPQP